jgi:hypothetical protein
MFHFGTENKENSLTFTISLSIVRVFQYAKRIEYQAYL